MSSDSTISRQHVAFAVAGTIFGFLGGFLVANLMYGGRHGGATAANAPETMGGQRGSPVVSQPAPPGMGGAPSAGGDQGGGPDMGQMERVKQELAALKKALDADPNNVAALTRLGDMYMDAGMFDKSVDYFRRALDVEPANVDVRTDMGTCLREMGRVQEALQVFQDSVSRDPKHWKSWFNIGIVYLYYLGDYTKAEEAFLKAHDLNPRDIDMNAVRAEIEKIRQEKAGRTAGSTPS